MINNPPVDVLLEELGTPEEAVSRYALCVVVAKRARQIMEQSGHVRDTPGHLKEIALACEEIASGKIKAVKD